MKRPMNDQDIRARLHAAADRGLSGLRDDPTLARRVLAQAKGEKPIMKKKFPVALAAAIILISAFTVALAAGALRGFGTINWKGVFLPEEMQEGPFPTPTPSPEELDRAEEEMALLVDETTDGELVAVYAREGDQLMPRSCTQVSRTTPSLEALADSLGEASAWLPLVRSLPEGYELEKASLFYECRAGGNYTLASEEEKSAGLVVRHYTLSEEDRFVSGYSLDFRASDGHYVCIYVSLHIRGESDDFAIGVLEDQTFETLSVPGMDDAVYITSEEVSYLDMRRVLETEIECLPGIPGETELEPETLGEAHVNIMTDNGISKEEMLALFE